MSGLMPPFALPPCRSEKNSTLTFPTAPQMIKFTFFHILTILGSNRKAKPGTRYILMAHWQTLSITAPGRMVQPPSVSFPSFTTTISQQHCLLWRLYRQLTTRSFLFRMTFTTTRWLIIPHTAFPILSLIQAIYHHYIFLIIIRYLIFKSFVYTTADYAYPYWRGTIV